MLKNLILVVTISRITYCGANYTSNVYNTLNLNERKSRANLVSFEPLGEHIELGLDFLLPFIKVPIVRKVDAYGNEPALINVNSAALISTGLLAGFSALVSYIFKRYVIFGREALSDKRRRYDNNINSDLGFILNNLKLVYKNSTGAKVDTTFSGLIDTIHETFRNNDIDLRSCIQKSICNRLQLSSKRVIQGNSSGIDKIIDGLKGIGWLMEFLKQTSFKDIIDNSDNLKNHLYCDIKYSQCKWSKPEDNLNDIIKSYMNFI